MSLLFSFRVAKWPPVWERAVIRFTVRFFRELLSIYVCATLRFDFESGMWNLIVNLTIKFDQFWAL